MSLTTSRPGPAHPLTDADIQEIVLNVMRTANLARAEDAQLPVAPNAALFGPESPLDSLGLLSLLLDVEQELHTAGYPVMLSDDRAMSQRRSPFRTVASLVEYIGTVVRE
jgi:acyl carrier protein